MSAKQLSTEQMGVDHDKTCLQCAVSMDITDSCADIPKHLNRIQRARGKAVRNFKIYEKIIRKINKADDVRTLGLHLECDHDDIEYYLDKFHQDPRSTAYQIFRWFEDSYPDGEDKWSKLIEALKELGKNTTVAELGLDKLLENAKQEKYTV